jgi:hypothetical protein
MVFLGGGNLVAKITFLKKGRGWGFLIRLRIDCWRKLEKWILIF